MLRLVLVRIALYTFFGVFLLLGGLTAGAWFAQSLPVSDLKAGHLWASASQETASRAP